MTAGYQIRLLATPIYHHKFNSYNSQCFDTMSYKFSHFFVYILYSEIDYHQIMKISQTIVID